MTELEFCFTEKEAERMKKSRYNEEQIIGILREADGQSSIKSVCARHNVSEATFYAWKKKYSGMDVGRRGGSRRSKKRTGGSRIWWLTKPCRSRSSRR